MTPKLSCFLSEYEAERESVSLHPGKLLSLDDLVFTNENSKPIDASTLPHNFGRIVKRAGLVARFRDLRYSYGSLMLAAGVHPEMVSKALGHSKVALRIWASRGCNEAARFCAANRCASASWGGMRGSFS